MDQTITVGVGQSNDLLIDQFEEDATGSRFHLIWKGELVVQINWSMHGLFNARNLAMAILSSCLSQKLENADKNISDNPFSGTRIPDYSKCRGVKRRQEQLFDSPSLTILSDFAHHPTAIFGALVSLRARWSDRKIVACFEPRSNTAVTNVFQDRFAQSLALADFTLIGQVHRPERMPKQVRIDPAQMIQFIRSEGKKGEAFPSNQELGAYQKKREFATPGEKLLVVFFSNGSFDGVIQEFVELAESDFPPS